jgi:hypothetical protein
MDDGSKFQGRSDGMRTRGSKKRSIWTGGTRSFTVKHHLIFRLPVVSGEKKNTYEQFRSSHHDGTREHFLMCVVLFVNDDAHRVHNSR